MNRTETSPTTTPDDDAATRPAGTAAVPLRLDDVSARPGGVAVLDHVDLTVDAGTTTTLVGPSGAGKTTLLRVVAGLEAAATGSVHVGDRDLTPTPVHRRRIGVVFQEPRLLPHRTVIDNVAFGLEAAGTGRDERRARAAALLEAVGLAAVADTGVTSLSGGEQQRVNLARALAVDPPVLLLDEPLAAVDAERREELRTLVADLTADRTTLHVTHDLAEAAELGDRVAVLLGGRVVQHGPPREVLDHPADVDVARFVGATTLLAGTVRDGVLLVAGADGDAWPLHPVGGPDGPATVAVRPEHVRVTAYAGEGPPPGVVETCSYRGTHVRLRVRLPGGATVAADVAADEARGPGARVTIGLRHAHRLPDTTPEESP